MSDIKTTGGATPSTQKTYMSNTSMLLLLTPPTCICSRSARLHTNFKVSLRKQHLYVNTVVTWMEGGSR